MTDADTAVRNSAAQESGLAVRIGQASIVDVHKYKLELGDAFRGCHGASFG